MKKYLLFILGIFAISTIDAQILLTAAQVTAINTAQSAAAGDIYKDTENNVFYIGTSSGLLKIIGDVSKVGPSLAGDGSVANPLRIASMGASSGQVLSWNGTSWTPVNPTATINTVSNTINAGQLTTTVNGVTSNPVLLPSGSTTYLQNDISQNTTVVGGNGTIYNPYYIMVNGASATTRGVIRLTGDFAGTDWWPVIANGAVVNSRLGDNAVTTDKIQDWTITTADFAHGAVTSDKIADGTITTIDIANSQITYPKMQNVTSARLLGNPTGSAAAPSEIVLGSGLNFSGNVLNVSQFQVKAIQVYDNQTSTQTIGNNASTLRLNTVSLNLGSNYTLSNNVITVSQSGVYRITFTAGTTSMQNNGERSSKFWIEINGTINPASYLYQHTYGGSIFCSSTSIIVQLNTNAEIRVRMEWVNNDHTYTVPECSSLNIEKLD